MNTKTKSTAFIASFAALIGLFVVSAGLVFGQETSPATNVASDEAANINAQIEQKKQRVEELRQQADAYQKELDRTTSSVKDLQGQIQAIDGQIAQTNFSIQAKEEEIDSLELEINALQHSIDEKVAEMNSQKENLTSAIKKLDQSSRTSTLALVLTHDSLADFYSQAQALASLSDALERSVTTLKTLKEDLEAKQTKISETRDNIKAAKLQLEVQKRSTVEQKELKEDLLSTVKDSSDQYNDLLAQASREEEQANATIGTLERQLQEKLASQGNDAPDFSSKGYIWPVKGNGISALFRDPSYPFSCRTWKNPSCLEHSGLDIRTGQGTPVRAAADGIVSVVHDQGFYYNAAGQKTRSALNFVGLLHEGGISTRYLHLSAVYVRTNQFVRQGEVIGLSGGLPGTAGAGGITTGAHLHFEVRVNGIPDDPLKYLP